MGLIYDCDRNNFLILNGCLFSLFDILNFDQKNDEFTKFDRNFFLSSLNLFSLV